MEIVKGQISGIRAMPPTDFRRLMYGLDLLAEKPVAVEEIPDSREDDFCPQERIAASRTTTIRRSGPVGGV